MGLGNRFFDVLMFSIIGAMLVVIFVTGAGTTKAIVPTLTSGWLKQLVILSGSQAPSNL